jgi:hypothetical protein
MNDDMLDKISLRKPEGRILFFLLGMFFCIMLLQALPVAAEEENLPDRFMLRMGGYNVRNANTIVRLDANNLPAGAYIDFHQTLGGDTTATVGRMDALYRFNEKHGAGLSWYALRFKGSRVLSKDVTWGDQTFSANTQVDSEIRFDVYKLNYQYSLFHNEKAELGALFGFHVMRTFASINGTSQSQSQAITAPLPVFGLFADYNFTPRLSAYYNFQLFSINYQDTVRGGMQDFLFGLEYRLFRHVALGAAYNRFSLTMDAKGDAATIHLDSSWNGTMAYAAVYF